MISKNPNITRMLKEYRERILSLEGQAAELSDRVAEYEQAEMLRKVSEADIIQRSAEDITSRSSDEDMESYKARLREELRIEAEANAEKKYEAERRKLEEDRKIGKDMLNLRSRGCS